MQTTSIRRIQLLSLIAAIGVGGWYAWSGLVRSSKSTTDEIDETDRSRAAEPAKIFAGGTVEGANREIPLRFELSGRLKELHVREGDFVEKGSVLAELDAELWELKFAEAGTLLKLARAERDRLAKLVGTAVRKEDLTIADAKVALAEGTVRRERLMLDKTLMRTPSDGIVLRVLAERGELVGPGDNRELFTLVDRSSTRVRAWIEELDAMNVAVGQKAVVIADGKPDKHYAGVVHSCSPYVSPKWQRHLKPGEMVDVRVREVLIELTDGSDLLIGLPVEVFIEAGQPDGASGTSPSRHVPLRPTPRSASPQMGQKTFRPPGRPDSLNLESQAASQPVVQRSSSLGEWKESVSRE